MNALPNLSIVIPCYNEQEVLPETSQRMEALLTSMIETGKIAQQSKVFFVDDGSNDRTWPLIESLAEASSRVSGIKLTRNRGHQNALIAGLFTAPGDVLISIDADLQDDLNAIEEMIDQYRQGSDIVYGVRKERKTDTFFKRASAKFFYKLIAMLGAESIYNHADYRLMSRRAIEALKQFQEINLYLRGIVPLIGFQTGIVEYDRSERFAGESKYPLRKMISLALEAITSFSVVPLRVITFTGFITFIGSMIVTAWTLWVRFVAEEAVPGWTSIVLPMYFLGGIQIFCIGMLGEYLGKTYAEVKARPRFLIEKVINLEQT